ncbi:hypothetical protein EYZ11_008833 [Aspergillus tanneri]|uniref:Uncharacterized protein n=1 Tax=Aspergillus tanneri TaxID=1220188 RepID=A0A4S3JBM4_9EURO|nr:hypothetical protein EYZ11_008833 [Aspergillus tanneri]
MFGSKSGFLRPEQHVYDHEGASSPGCSDAARWIVSNDLAVLTQLWCRDFKE